MKTMIDQIPTQTKEAVKLKLFTIELANGKVIARCGDAKAQLNIQDNVVYQHSGNRCDFRSVVKVDYASDEEGVEFTPKPVLYTNVIDYITDVARTKFAGRLMPISRMDNSRGKADVALSALLGRIVNQLYSPYDPQWDTESDTSFEEENQKRTIVLDKNESPRIRGVSWTERELNKRETFADYVEALGLSNRLFTQVGNPGTTLDRIDSSGFPLYAKVNPLLVVKNFDGNVECTMPQGRWGVARGIGHAIRVKGGSSEPLIRIKGLDSSNYPSSVPLRIVCIEEQGFEDAIVISKSAADKLEARSNDIRKLDIDGLINYYGGIRYRGRNLAPELDEDKQVSFAPHDTFMQSIIKQIGSAPTKSATDAELLRQIYSEFESEYKAVIAAATPEIISKRFKSYLADHKLWRERKEALANQPVCRRFDYAEVDRVCVQKLTGTATVYRVNAGEERKKLSKGDKLQAFGDLFKGTVAQILPDEAMPIIKYANGKQERAEIVCEMGQSTKKHGSLRLAHMQMALYQLASHWNGFSVDHDKPLGLQDIINMCMDEGLYEDETLTCKVLSCDGEEMGDFPVGIMPVVRHRQDASVVGGVRGKLADKQAALAEKLQKLEARQVHLLEKLSGLHGRKRSNCKRAIRRTLSSVARLVHLEERGIFNYYPQTPNRMKLSGVRSGYIDSAIRRSCGFEKCDQELRRVPGYAQKQLECLRMVIS